MIKKPFGVLPNGEQAFLYSIRCGNLEAAITDYGAALVTLMVPDREGILADVVLGFDNANAYRTSDAFLGAVVGRNAGRIGGACFTIGNKEYRLSQNDGKNNLHSGPNAFCYRMWTVSAHTESEISLTLESPDGDQGFPGKAKIQVTYTLDKNSSLRIAYDAVSDADTVFNFTNHAYFNLAGHNHPQSAMEQILCIQSNTYTVDDAESVSTGQTHTVEDTPLDFRIPKPIGRDIHADYEDLQLQGGYDHNYEVLCNPCAVLSDPVSGRTMRVTTDCPGIQLYTGNHLSSEMGKNGVIYHWRSGVCLETQFYPDAVNHCQWAQPITRAGEPYHSETLYCFSNAGL